MANGWTPERRARQAEMIHSWKPWDKATGPRTPEGKAVVSRNAYTGAKWLELRQFTKLMNATLQHQKRIVEGIG
jgi:hypothetical protein